MNNKESDHNVKHSRASGITKKFVIIFLPLLVLISFIIGGFLKQEK